MKKRYIIVLCVALILILGSFVPFTRPVRPFIQLPGEIYPFTKGLPILGGITNTFMSSLLAFIVIVVMVVLLKARSRTADEVPTGFYNFFEMVIEGAYNFAEGIASHKVKDFFPIFMTFILYILVTNWMGLLPGWDSIGMWEHKPHFRAEKEIKDLESDLKTAYAEGDESLNIFLSGLESQYDFPIEVEAGEFSKETKEEILHELEHDFDEENSSDLRVGTGPIQFLIRADANGTDTEPMVDENGRKSGYSQEAADWTIVPFFRPGATDLNFTLAFALVAMGMVQFYGIKYLGLRGYLSKFFPFISKGFGKEVGKNPIKAIDPAVGLLELISEISKIISFAFRLLGNLFAGMVLLFVMAFLLPVANVAFFGLEFFVGLIQAIVFGLLMLIFMVSATESHHGDEEHH